MLRIWLPTLLLVGTVLANTEVLNFYYPQHFEDLPPSIEPKPKALVYLSEPKDFLLPCQPRGSYSSSSSSSDLAPRPSTQTVVEFTYQINLDGHAGPFKQWFENNQRKFGIGAGRTARVSWPASHPVDLELEIFGIPERLSRATHFFGAYLVISCRPTSVESPITTTTKTTTPAFDSVPVTIVVEPVWLEVIPETLLGGIAFVVVLVLALVVSKAPQRVAQFLTRLVRTEDVDKED